MNILVRILLLVLLSFCILSCHREERRAGMDVIVPTTYRGWVFLILNPPADRKRHHRIELKIPASGILEAKVHVEEGWGEDRYFFEGAGQRIPIPLNMRHPATFGVMPDGPDGKKRTYMAFFVGDEQGWKKTGSFENALSQMLKVVPH